MAIFFGAFSPDDKHVTAWWKVLGAAFGSMYSCIPVEVCSWVKTFVRVVGYSGRNLESDTRRCLLVQLEGLSSG